MAILALKETKAKLPRVFKLLTSHPRHPPLQVKKLKGALRPDIYECRLNQSWRIILRQAGEMAYDLVYVGAHDEAISYGLQVRERGAAYGESMNVDERLRSYLAGDDTAIVFVPATPGDFERFAS